MNDRSTSAWTVTPLGKVSTITVGGTPSTDVPEFWSGYVPWMASGDIHRYRINQVSGRISENGLQHSNAKLVAAGAVAVALAGQGKTRGTVALTQMELCTNQSVALVSPDTSKLLPEFLFQSLIPRYEELRASSSGGGRGGLTKGILERFPVAFPSIGEQRRIAAVLLALDEQIDALVQSIGKSESVREGVVRGLLERLSGAPLEPLATLASVGSGITLGRKYSGPGTADYPYLRVANVQDGRLDLAEVKTIRLPVAVAEKTRLEVGDVLMNEGGDADKLGRGTVWNGEIEHCLHQNHVFRVRCNQSKLLPGFLALWAASAFGRRFFLHASKQSTNLASINSTQLKKFPVLRPSVVEQCRVVQTVGALDSALGQDIQELEKLKALKQGLARALFSDGAGAAKRHSPSAEKNSSQLTALLHQETLIPA